jgi:hypothetical protein
MDALLTTVYLFICIVLLGIGFALGKSSASDDCKNFGAFAHESRYYTCAPSAPRYQK